MPCAHHAVVYVVLISSVDALSDDLNAAFGLVELIHHTYCTVLHSYRTAYIPYATL